MFGLEFLFGYALWALPLAGLPILLHLLFRRKSPVVPFSTLRFIKSSIQRTAARKRVQRWMLLACRALLLALLIWAIAQPARKLTAGWFGSSSIAAAIVVDTSYSMQLQDHQATLLLKANDSIDELLRGPLQSARVALFKSQPTDQPEGFESAATIQKNWRQLTPQPALVPLVDRVARAIDQLKQQDVDHRWLIVVSDLHRREFPRSLPDFPEGRTILLDLHPDENRAATITRVVAEPSQPRLGIAAQVAIEVSGRANDSRAVSLAIAPADNPTAAIAQPSLPMAKLDNGGRTALRVPFTFGAQSWLLLKASLQTADDLPWAASRDQLVKVPSPAVTAILPSAHPNALADAILRLALDPGQGSHPAWPVMVRPAGPIKGDETIIAANFTAWPDEPTVRQLADFARRGGTLVLFVQPGLEESWRNLPASEKAALSEILPGAPSGVLEAGPFRASIARLDDVLLSDVGDTQSASGKLLIGRLVPFDISDASVQTILNAGPDNPAMGAKLHGLLMRRKIGTGQVYTWATLPTPLYGNLPTYELFVPILVNTAIRPEVETHALNMEIGNRIELPGQQAPTGVTALDLVPPQGPPYQVNVTQDANGRRFVSDPVNDPGLYAWRQGDQTIAYTNVQYPSEEARLDYRPSAEVALEGPNVLVARSMTDLQAKMQKASEPDARWTGPIAIVLFLLCIEALMGSVSKIWKPVLPRFFVPKLVPRAV